MWQMSERCYAQGFSSSKGVNAQGYHGKRVLIIADEAVGISQDVWDAIEGVRAAGDVRMVKLCNPTGNAIINFGYGPAVSTQAANGYLGEELDPATCKEVVARQSVQIWGLSQSTPTAQSIVVEQAATQ
jgi:hypothetical protein